MKKKTHCCYCPTLRTKNKSHTNLQTTKMCFGEWNWIVWMGEVCFCMQAYESNNNTRKTFDQLTFLCLGFFGENWTWILTDCLLWSIKFDKAHWKATKSTVIYAEIPRKSKELNWDTAAKFVKSIRSFKKIIF